MRTMIESSLRGNIVYNDNLGDGVWSVKVDLAELELAIVNIAVNARDAMPNGGTLSINDVTVDQEIGDNRLRGVFFAIALSDTGTGIRQILCPKCSIHSSQPKRSAKEPGSVCRRFTVLRTKPAER